MKILKLIFSRFTITVLLVILQATFFISLFAFLDVLTPYYFVITTAFTVIGFLLVLVLVNRETNPNYILPWIIIILSMSPFGVLIYLMFSQNRLGKKQKKRYNKIYQDTLEYAGQDEAVKKRLEQKDRALFGQSEYLTRGNGLPVYDNTDCKYFRSNEKFYERLLEELKKAKRFIFFEYFIIEPGVMWNSILDIVKQKLEDGVEVRVMYDDIGCISTLKSGYDRELRKLGIKCVKFNKFLPVMSAIHNNRDHRKMTIIDGETGFMGGGNLADEYINIVQHYGLWKDSAVMLKGEAVKSMTIMFLQNYNAQTGKGEDYAPYIPEFSKAENGGFLQPFYDGPLPLYTEKVGQTAIANIINQAEKYVYITTPYLIIDFMLTEAIKNAAKRGVDVRIVTPHKPDKKLIFLMTRSSYRPLIKAGVKIAEYLPGFMHSKSILCDDKVGIVGSINLDYRSLVHHFECGVWMAYSPALAELKQDFDEILAVSEEISYEKSRLNIFQKLLKNVLQLFAPLL